MIRKGLFAGMSNPNMVILILTNFERSHPDPAQNGSDPQSNTQLQNNATANNPSRAI
jgi:hypothetical protein